MTIYKCCFDNCKNSIIPCLTGDSCNECKKKLIINNLNNINKKLPKELIYSICNYINDENKNFTCNYCKKYICIDCYSNSYNTNWCCNCFFNF